MTIILPLHRRQQACIGKPWSFRFNGPSSLAFGHRLRRLRA